MTGKNIGISVNRAFQTIGILFIAGGLYLGVLMWINTPQYVNVQGEIVKIRVEKIRPLGFEDIPLDTKDPEYADIPVNTNTYANVEYSYLEKDYSSEIVSWNEENSWQLGDTINIYFSEKEPEYPSDYLSKEDSNKKIFSLAAGIGMSIMGFLLFMVGTWQKIKDSKYNNSLINKLDKLKRPEPFRNPYGNDSILHDKKIKGNFFMGGIIGGIGFILFISMMFGLLKDGELISRLMLVFPLLLSLGLMYMGFSDFFIDRVIVTETEVRLIHKALWGRFDRRELLSSFSGIMELIVQKQLSGSMKRHIYREQVLVHRDSCFNELSISLIPDNSKSVETARALSRTLNLPRILFDAQKPFLEYPDGEIIRKNNVNWGSDSSIVSSKTFPGKYLKLVDDKRNHLLIIRSYRKGLIWSGIFFIAGFVLFFVTGMAVTLFPLIMMSLIFGSISMKGDRLEVLNNKLIIEKFWFKKNYLTKSIYLEQLEEIILGNDPMWNNAQSLEIIGKGKRIYFGQSAGEEELTWIKLRLKEMIV